jgi:hypothetical protein
MIGRLKKMFSILTVGFRGNWSQIHPFIRCTAALFNLNNFPDILRDQYSETSNILQLTALWLDKNYYVPLVQGGEEIQIDARNQVESNTSFLIEVNKKKKRTLENTTEFFFLSERKRNRRI